MAALIPALIKLFINGRRGGGGGGGGGAREPRPPADPFAKAAQRDDDVFPKGASDWVDDAIESERRYIQNLLGGDG